MGARLGDAEFGRCCKPSSSGARACRQCDLALLRSPSGYYHNRRRSIGYCCAAVTRTGGLYTWGPNFSGEEQTDPVTPSSDGLDDVPQTPDCSCRRALACHLAKPPLCPTTYLSVTALRCIASHAAAQTATRALASPSTSKVCAYAIECALLHEERLVSRPTLVPSLRGGWAAAERVTHAACGLDFLAIALRASRRAPSEIDGATLDGVANGGQGEALAGRSGAGACANGVSRVLSCGSFVFEPPHALKEWEELRDLSLRSLVRCSTQIHALPAAVPSRTSLARGLPYLLPLLDGITKSILALARAVASQVAGSFHCCALSTRGELYTFGDTRGRDISNGNLLGHGDPEEGAAAVNWAEGPPEPALPRPPRRLQSAAMGPVTEVSCTTYATLALSVDGRAFSWGDSDGNALGHASRECHTPTLVPMPAGTRVAHGDLSYTNAAVATDDGRCFVWGGNSWVRRPSAWTLVRRN
eukprot:4443424-Pleurochrysis_carterae.AAC.1